MAARHALHVQHSSGGSSVSAKCSVQPQVVVADASSDEQTRRKSSSPSPTPPLPQPTLDAEITAIALPMLIALATDPIAGLVDTAMIGRIGAVELAGLGVGLSIFNTITKFLNVPLVSATTTAVAEAVGMAQLRPTTIASIMHESGSEAADAAAGGAAGSSASGHVPIDESVPLVARTAGSSSAPAPALDIESGGPTSMAVEAVSSSAAAAGHDAVSVAASSALMMAVCIGVLEALAIYALSPYVVQFWGLAAGSAAHAQGTAFLHVRAFSAPFTVILLTLQGIFRGLTDTRTPLVASLSANILNVGLAPLLIFGFHWGVPGAAAAVGLSQVVPCLWLLWRLSLRTSILSVQGAAVQHLLTLLRPSGLLLLRTASVTATYAYATSAVARAGPTYAAAHQVAFSLWLSTTLLADSLAVAAQSLLATKAAAGDVQGARKAAERCVELGCGLGIMTAALVAVFRHPIAHVFTKDAGLLAGVASVMPLLIVTQPINALAFVWDGVLFGAGGFRYASLAMAACAVPACALIRVGAHVGAAQGLVWVWGGLSALMMGRALTIYLPWVWKVGPFAKLRTASDD